MHFRALSAPVLLMGLSMTALVALQAADDKVKAKDAQAQQPGIIKFTAAPAAVQKTFRDETKNAKIELLGEGKGEDNTVFYKAIVPVGASDYEMAVAADGQLLEKIMNPLRSEVKLEECPPAVQKALRDDSKGAKVNAIEKITAGRRADYIMSVQVQKLHYQIVFTEDGTLMSKVLDDNAGQEVPTPEAAKVSEKLEKMEKPKKK
jgi:hypothetical protein